MFRIITSVFLFIPLLLSANNGLDQRIKDGLHKSYNFQLDDAEVIFHEVLDDYPEQPHAYHYLAQINLWKYLGTRDESFILQFYKYSDLSIQKSDSLFTSQEDNPKLLNLMGWIYTLRAIAKTTEQETLDAFWATKSAVAFFEDALDSDPEYYYPYLGKGIFDYTLSFVPGMLQWALVLTGLSADKYLGLTEVKLAYEKSKESFPESSYHLARFYTEFIADYDSADYHLEQIITEYPENSLFRYQRVLKSIEARDFQTSKNEIAKIQEIDNAYLKQTNNFCFFLLGEINFMENNFEDAKSMYRKFIDSSLVVDYCGMANYKIAISEVMLGDKDNFKYNLIKSNLGNKDIYDDNIAYEKSKYFLSNDFSSEDSLLTIYENYVNSGRYNSLIDTGNNNDSLLITQEARIKLGILKLDSFLKTNRIVEADSMVQYLEQHIVALESNYKPYFYLLASKVMLLKDEFEKAKELILEAEDQNEYEFPHKIEAKINFVKRKLGLEL